MITPGTPFCVREYVLFGACDSTIVKVDVYNVGMTSKNRLRAGHEHRLERAGKVESFKENTMGKVHKKRNSKGCMELGCGECDEIIDGQAEDVTTLRMVIQNDKHMDNTHEMTEFDKCL
jgi:hypothetical protein